MTRLLLALDTRYMLARWSGRGHVAAAWHALRGVRRELREAQFDAQERERLGL